MISRHIKLKLNKEQEKEFNSYLFHLTGIYNWTIRKIQINLGVKVFKSDEKTKGYFGFLNEYDLNNQISGHARRIGVHSQVCQTTIKRACNAWQRCFNKTSGKPRLKSFRNKLTSFVFPQVLKRNYPSIKTGKINLPGLGLVGFHRQSIPDGNIKQIKIIKKASGWYACLVIDTVHKITKVKDIESSVGIDTGLKDIAVLSDGTKYHNPREYVNSLKQMRRLQRGVNRKKVARMHEHIKNKRKDRNHKISLDIVRNHKEIYVTNDNLNAQSKRFGKSVSDAGIGQLRRYISYKSSTCGRKFSLVDNRNSTRICNICWSLTGPKGLNQLGVRFWKCSACGADHDRDINSALVTLKIGRGLRLDISTDVKPETLHRLESPSDAMGMSRTKLIGTRGGITAYSLDCH